MYQLKNQKGERIGPVFNRYQDAFNYRASINGVGLIVTEL